MNLARNKSFLSCLAYFSRDEAESVGGMGYGVAATIGATNHSGVFTRNAELPVSSSLLWWVVLVAVLVVLVVVVLSSLLLLLACSRSFYQTTPNTALHTLPHKQRQTQT